ncbi:MAG: 30S ribosomal protein S14 [Halobacteriovorax sp.]|nr:30S ribosomal protein S14 [Halobacteriovorax sp.]|tara:strand:- start:205798 stop:206103 length:306 start_codon:yes stop_codon:yes gene_type:complete
MPRRAKIVSNDKRRKMAEKHLKLRKELRATVKNTNLTDDERWAAQDKLQKLPRNSCENRVRNRCVITGRSRGVYRAFGLSRLEFRRLALRGMLPGVTKSSW